MLPSVCWLSVTLFVAVVVGDFDQNFCTQRIGNVGPNDNMGLKPTFDDNFYVFIEKKVSSTRNVIYEDEYFSLESGIAYGTVRGKVNQTQTWVDTKTDEIIVGPIGTQVCTAATLTAANSEQLMGVTVNSAGNVTMTTPDAALGWDQRSQNMTKNIGAGSARGISTLVWQVCTYNKATDVTAVSEWHVVDPSLTLLPMITQMKVLKPILPVLVKVQSISHTDPSRAVTSNYSVDFTFFDNVEPTDEIFQTPTTMLCSTKPSAQVPLPASPAYFKFKGEQITINNVNTQSPSAPDLVFTVEEYSQLSQLFVQDFVTTPQDTDSGNDKSYIRHIDDFTIGLTFEVNLISGSCSVTPISDRNVDAVPAAGGKVAMRTPQQFFDLDSNQYQYMGVHTKRGISCDAWSAYFTDGKLNHPPNTLFTWYFANAQWMKSNGFGSSVTFPVALEVQQDTTYQLFNFYEFDTQDQMKLPDISLCFDTSTTLNIDFHISASYSQMVAPDVNAFNKAVYSAVVLATNLLSVLRITALDVQPTSASDIIVMFKLLDMASINTQGDVTLAQHDAANSQILADLCQSINSGNFVIDITSVTDAGTAKRTVTAQANSCGQCPGAPALTTPQQPSPSFSGQPIATASPALTTPQQPSPSFSGQPIATASPALTTIDAQQYSSPQSSSYSAGSMAGIGTGMLVLGFVLGFVLVFAFKRFRKPTSSDAVYDMKKLEEEQS